MKDIAYKEMYENELRHPWYISTRSVLLHFLSNYLAPNAIILDAGCGTGGTYIYLKKAGFKRVYGIDISKHAIKFCRERSISRVRLASVEKIPFRSNYFDAIICLDVLYHKGVLAKRVLREFHRVLKPNGILYMQEPAYNWLRGMHDKAIETRYRFSSKELRTLTESNGFKVLRNSHFNFFLMMPLLLKRLFENKSDNRKVASDVKQNGKLIDVIALTVLKVEEELIKRINFPFGLSIICISRKN